MELTGYQVETTKIPLERGNNPAIRWGKPSWKDSRADRLKAPEDLISQG